MKYGIRQITGNKIIHQNSMITDEMRFYVAVNPLAHIVKKTKGGWKNIS